MQQTYYSRGNKSSSRSLSRRNLKTLNTEKRLSPMLHSKFLKGNNTIFQPAKIHLLDSQSEENLGKKTLVLDLDETLIHSSFTLVPDADMVVSIPSEFDCKPKNVFVKIRPGAFKFIQK